MKPEDTVEIKEKFIEYWQKVSELGIFPFMTKQVENQPFSRNDLLALWLVGKFYQPMLLASVAWHSYGSPYLFDFNNYRKWQVST